MGSRPKTEEYSSFSKYKVKSSMSNDVSSKDVSSKDVGCLDTEKVRLENNVIKTNNLIGSVKKSNKKLFDQVKKSYSDLYDENDKKVWKKYKVLVDLDDSTVNKIVKIVTNDTIMRFYDHLPGSWGTLSVLTTMDENNLVEVIEEGRITPTSTKSSVMKIRDEYKDKESGSDDKSKDKESTEWVVNQLWINLDELDVSDEDRSKIQSMFDELKGYGFTIIEDKESESYDTDV